MATGELTAMDRFANTLLLGLLAILGISGIVMLYGSWQPWVFDLHRMAGFALLLLAPWKGATIYRSFMRGMRPDFDRSIVLLASWIFAHLVLLVIILGGLWMWRLGPYSSLLQTLVAWHWILGLLLLPLLILHVWWRWPNPRKQDFLTRRDFLRLAGVAGAGVLAGSLADWLAEGQATQESPRRFTGSRGFGLFAGNDFPITGEATQELDAGQWRLAVTGAVRSPLTLAYADILARTTQSMTEIIDCTSGWYSIQDWQGVRLIDILQEAGLQDDAAGVRLFSTTGYNHSYPMEEARKILLATHVTGQVLEPRHGFPLRAVVPGRRGWFWVKWLAGVDVLDSPWEVLGGILGSPRQVLRQW